jgi:AcrR family transcriptional regulator
MVNHEERREEIVEAVRRVIEWEGLAGADLREIAHEAGYTPRVITHYFQDKRELMTSAFGLLVEHSTSRMARASAKAGLMEALAQVLPLDEERRRETTVSLAPVSASLTNPQLAEGLRLRYRQAREAMFCRCFGRPWRRCQGKTSRTPETNSWPWLTGSPSTLWAIPRGTRRVGNWRCGGGHWQAWAFRQELLRASTAKGPV